MIGNPIEISYWRELEKENRLDGRQVQLSGRKIVKVSALQTQNVEENKATNKKNKQVQPADIEIAALDNAENSNFSKRSQGQDSNKNSNARPWKDTQPSSRQKQVKNPWRGTGTVQIPAIHIQSRQLEVPNRMEGQKQNSQGHAKVSRPYRQDEQQPLEFQAQGHPQGPQCLRCDGYGHIANYCPTLTCYKCQGKGHVAKNCKPPKRQEKYCYRCGEPNVRVRECPKSNL